MLGAMLTVTAIGDVPGCRATIKQAGLAFGAPSSQPLARRSLADAHRLGCGLNGPTRTLDPLDQQPTTVRTEPRVSVNLQHPSPAHLLGPSSRATCFLVLLTRLATDFAWCRQRMNGAVNAPAKARPGWSTRTKAETSANPSSCGRWRCVEAAARRRDCLTAPNRDPAGISPDKPTWVAAAMPLVRRRTPPLA